AQLRVREERSLAMKQRWALVLLGAWLMGSICMSIVATQNFYTVDRLRADQGHGAFAAMVQKLGQPAARELLRYLSSELNRLYFQMWNVAQLVLGVAMLWLLAGSREQDPAYVLGSDRDTTDVVEAGPRASASRRAGPF